MDSSPSVRVVIADDHPLIRAGVMATLSAHEEFQVVGQAKNSLETLELVRSLKPHLLILDLDMQDQQPAALVEQCAQEQEWLKVLIFSGCCEPRDVEILNDSRVRGFVSKQEGPESLLQAVRVVLAGETWFSHQVTQSLRQLRQLRSQRAELALSEREAEVLRGMLQAKDDQGIADALGLSRHTVRRYVTRIFQKLDVRNRMEAIVWGNQNEF